MRLIDADALIKAITEHCRSEVECLNHFWYDENIIALIDNAPTVDLSDFYGKAFRNGEENALKIRNLTQGEWEKCQNNMFRCSNCRQADEVPTSMGIPIYNFCPNCGADMRGDNNG